MRETPAGAPQEIARPASDMPIGRTHPHHGFTRAHNACGCPPGASVGQSLLKRCDTIGSVADIQAATKCASQEEM
eukprot:140402-Alexandrium_andersonii.AAC.1